MVSYMNNYHTHTFRCTHAFGTEEDMVKKAIEEGYDILGFSEHVPLPHLRWHLIKAIPFGLRGFWSTLSWVKTFLFNGPGMRMPYKEKKDHINAVNLLKEKYKKQIQIRIGFECEYIKEYLPYYQKLLESKEVDYLILGHHYHQFLVGRRYYGRPNLAIKDIKNYVREAKKGLESGLFSYFAHPDLFMNSYHEWNEEVEGLVKELCECAKDNHIPLEINAGGLRKEQVMINGVSCYTYPNYFFWKVASEVGCKAIIGMDAHETKHLNKEDYQQLVEFAKALNIELITTLK